MFCTIVMCGLSFWTLFFPYLLQLFFYEFYYLLFYYLPIKYLYLNLYIHSMRHPGSSLLSYLVCLQEYMTDDRCPLSRARQFIWKLLPYKRKTQRYGQCFLGSYCFLLSASFVALWRKYVLEDRYLLFFWVLGERKKKSNKAEKHMFVYPFVSLRNPFPRLEKSSGNHEKVSYSISPFVTMNFSCFLDKY